MALVGPHVPPADFSTLLYTLRHDSDVPGLGCGVLVTSLSLGERIVTLPVLNGLVIRHFISVTSLVDVDSPTGRSLPCAASSLSSRPLAILHVQRLLLLDFSLMIVIALLLSLLSSSV